MTLSWFLEGYRADLQPNGSGLSATAARPHLTFYSPTRLLRKRGTTKMVHSQGTGALQAEIHVTHGQPDRGIPPP